MKSLNTLLIFFVLISSCKSNQVTIPIYNIPNDYTSGRYEKDMDNNFNPYEGTWKWQNGNNSLTIQLKKITKYYVQNNIYNKFYRDYLIGEYTLVKNGAVVINSMPLNYSGEPSSHAISGGVITIMNMQNLPCQECNPLGRRQILVSIVELEHPALIGQLRMEHFVQNGVQKIKARIFTTDIVGVDASYTGPEDLASEGFYTLVKQ